MPKQDSTDEDTSDTNDILDVLVSLVMAEVEEDMFIKAAKEFNNLRIQDDSKND